MAPAINCRAILNCPCGTKNPFLSLILVSFCNFPEFLYDSRKFLERIRQIFYVKILHLMNQPFSPVCQERTVIFHSLLLHLFNDVSDFIKNKRFRNIFPLRNKLFFQNLYQFREPGNGFRRKRNSGCGFSPSLFSSNRLCFFTDCVRQMLPQLGNYLCPVERFSHIAVGTDALISLRSLSWPKQLPQSPEYLLIHYHF